MRIPLISRLAGAPPVPVVSVIRLSGIIGQVGPARRGMTVSAMAEPIERAFAVRGVNAVALAINSPGGSAVQSSLIHRRIRAHAEEKGVPVLAFVEDAAASGGYMLAVAADEIFADDSSIIGSIGVVSSGFGFQDLIARIGVERRVHATGARKAMLDPFQEERAEDVERLKALQEDAFAAFAEIVRSRRGQRLKAGEDELFTGDIWSGRRAAALGLVDGLGDIRSILRRRYGEELRLRVFEPARRNWLRRQLGMDGPERLAEALIATADERLYWSRLGL